MAMPDKKTHRPPLEWAVRMAEQDQFSPVVELARARVLLALADAEWAREERAAELEALQADRTRKAELENA